MAPGFTIVDAANAALADPNVRAQIRDLHAAGAPLVTMVEALGLDDDMSAAMRALVAGLPDDAVAGIRQATLAMLDSGHYEMPLDCTVTESQVEAGDPVRIDVVPEPNPTIRVRLRSAPG